TLVGAKETEDDGVRSAGARRPERVEEPDGASAGHRPAGTPDTDRGARGSPRAQRAAHEGTVHRCWRPVHDGADCRRLLSPLKSDGNGNDKIQSRWVRGLSAPSLF